MRHLLRTVGCVLAAMALASCTNSEIDPNTFYGDLSEAQQEKYMSALVAEFNAEAKKKGVDSEATTTGDVKRGIITITGSYPTIVTPEKLKAANTAIAKVKAQTAMCIEPDIIQLNSRGVGIETIMKDPNGTVVFREICEGDKFASRPYPEQSEAQRAYELAKMASYLNAVSAGSNLDKKVLHKARFEADITQHMIFEFRELKGTLTDENFDFMQKQLADLNKDGEICEDKPIQEMSKYGINYQLSITDKSGKPLAPTVTCASELKLGSSQAATPSLRGLTASR